MIKYTIKGWDKMDNINIEFDGTEKNKNEIVYNNVIKAMDDMDLSKDEQIDYLKNKIATFENDLKNRYIMAITVICGLLLLIFGIYLLLTANKVLGTIVIIASFVIVTAKLLLVIRKITKDKNSKYDRIEYLKTILDKKLK